MSSINNVRIVLDNGEVITHDELAIKLNRIVDDFANIDKRYGEYSFTFNLPKSKTNSRIFEFPDVKGRTRIFEGKQFPARLFDGSNLLLKGVIELTSFNNDSFNCNFYSSYTQLLDFIKGKKLVDLTSFDTVEWEYEDTIIDHINGTRISNDVEFPMVFYKSPFMSGATQDTDTTRYLKAEDNLGYYYNYVNSSLNFGKKNPKYYTNLPPAFYLKSIFKNIINEAGFSLSGSFFDNRDVSKIVIPYTNKAELLPGSIITTGATHLLNLNKVLPDCSQTEFLKSTINLFNLYFIVKDDAIVFETYNTLFSNTDNAYDITLKIDTKTIVVQNPDAETKITFNDDGSNNLVGGYGRLFDYSNINDNNPTNFLAVNNVIRTTIGESELVTQFNSNAFNRLWNKTTGDKEIKLLFSPANYMPYTIINEESILGNSSIAIPQLFTVGIPLVSKQTPSNNEGFKFADESDLNYSTGNNSKNVVYDGGIKLYYFYGNSSYNYKVGTSFPEPYSSWSWLGVAEPGGSSTAPTINRVKMPIASPFKLLTKPELDSLKSDIQYMSINDKTNEVGAEVQGLLNTFYTVGTTGNTHTPTSFSLTVGDSQFKHDNIFSYFHFQKYDTIRKGYLLKANMSMNSNDWNEMQINRVLKYNNELFQLVAIRGYDPVLGTASIEMMKK